MAIIAPDESRCRVLWEAFLPHCEVREFRTYPKGADELQWLLEQPYEIVIVDLDSDEAVAMELVQRISASGAAVMVASERADQRLAVRVMRAGACEFLMLPLEQGAVAEALARTPVVVRRNKAPAKKTLGNLFAFLGAKGGSGVTTATCNFAVALARSSEQKTLLIDFNFPIGDAALCLGISGERTTEDALANARRLDTFLLEKLLVKHQSGLMVLAAPSKFSDVEPTKEAIHKVLSVARSGFDHVIVDMGSRIDATGRAILKDASTVYLITQTGIAELRNANRVIARYFNGAVPKLEVVLNRFNSRMLEGVNEEAVGQALGKPVRWKIPDDQEAAREMEKGETGDAETRVSRVCLEIASSITGVPVPQKKKKGFGLRGLAGSIDEDTGGNTKSPSISIAPRVTWVYARSTPSIRWDTPAPIQCGEALSETQLSASASVAGSFEYNPRLGETLPAGTHALSVVFIPADDDKYAIAQATVQLEVALASPALTWPKPSPIPYGTPLSATELCATASVPGTFAYAPALGEVLAAGKHKLTVSFTPADTGLYTTANATVQLEVAAVTPAIDWPTPQPVCEGTVLSAAQLCAQASVPGSFEYSPPAGALLPAGTHTLSAVFVPADGKNYFSANATVSFVVEAKAIPAITWSKPDPIVYGTALTVAQLCATASVPGVFEYSPAPDEKLAAGNHTLRASFTPTDGVNYAAVEATVSLEVLKAEPVIEWPAPGSIKDVTPLSGIQLCASASVPGTFVYSPEPGITLAPGKHKLAVTFTPVDVENYKATRLTVPLLVVARKTPVISWAEPEPIPYGTALGEVQLSATAAVPGTFDYSRALGEILNAGKHPLTATFSPADTENYATAEATVSLEVTRVTPTLVWASPEPISYGALLDSIHLSATASVPGTFEYLPAAGALLAAGKHQIAVAFTPTDTVNYAPAEAAVSIEVAKAKPRLEWPAPETIECGTALGQAQLRATASVPGTFAYSPAPGELLAAGVHTLTAVFTPEDAANYEVAQTSSSLEVIKATPRLTWANPEALTYGTLLDPAQLCATASVPGTFRYSHASGDLLSAGSHQLSVAFEPTDSAIYRAVEAAVSLQVLQAKPTVAWATPETIKCGTPLSATQLCAVASVPGTFRYSPEPGTVLAAGTHTLCVAFTPADSLNYAAAEATVSIEVVKLLPALVWADPSPMTYGTRLGDAQLSATASVPGRFDYSPAMGAILSVGSHRLSVVFTPADSAIYALAETTASVEVVKAMPVLEWPAPQAMTCDALLGDSQLCASASVPGSFAYTPVKGTTLAAGRHTLSLTFTPADTANYHVATATVSLEVTRVIPLLDWPTPRPITCGTALGPSQLNAAVWIPGTFAYSPAAGVILPVGAHTLSVTFTPVDCTNYAEVQATVLLNVMEKPKPAVSWSYPSPVVYGTPISADQLCATASVPGTFRYSVAPGDVLTVGVHELSVTFTPLNTTEYDQAHATVTLTVKKAKPTVTWPMPDKIPYGTSLGSKQQCAKASVPGTFEYSPEAGKVLKVGDHVLSASFTPEDDEHYAAGRASVTLSVVKAKPTLEWPTPKPIRATTPLSSTELCATASVPGTFYYSHSSGEELPEGLHTLSASFMPADSEQYESAEAAVTLEVRQKFPWGTVLGILGACLLLLILFLMARSFSAENRPTPIEPLQPAPLAQPNAGKPKLHKEKFTLQKRAATATRSVHRVRLTSLPRASADQDSEEVSFPQVLDWMGQEAGGAIDYFYAFLERGVDFVRNAVS